MISYKNYFDNHKPTKNPNKYTFDDKCAYIHINGKDDVAIIDIEDYKKVKDYRWSYCNGYFQTSLSYKCISKTIGLHRLIMDSYEKNLVVDHINRNRLDNRKINLKIVTRSENALNSKINPLYGVAGISNFNGKWIASISPKGKTIKIGSFDNINDAIKARKDAELKFYNMNRIYQTEV